MMAIIELKGVDLPEVDLGFELYDEDGYPTEEALEALRRHKGTIPEMIALVCALYRSGGARLELGKDDLDREAVIFTTVTMGWSGCESVDAVLHDTLFYTTCWQSSSRGGLTVYSIGSRMWEAQGIGWGDPSPDLAAGFNTAAPQRDPAHIPSVLGALRRAWEAYPNATLAQVLVSTRFRGYTDDDEIVGMFAELADESTRLVRDTATPSGHWLPLLDRQEDHPPGTEGMVGVHRPRPRSGPRLWCLPEGCRPAGRGGLGAERTDRRTPPRRLEAPWSWGGSDTEQRHGRHPARPAGRVHHGRLLRLDAVPPRR